MAVIGLTAVMFVERQFAQYVWYGVYTGWAISTLAIWGELLSRVGFFAKAKEVCSCPHYQHLIGFCIILIAAVIFSIYLVQL